MRAGITPNLRAVTAEFGKGFIFLYFYFDEKPSEFEEELAEVTLTEVFCDFAMYESMFFEAKKIHLPYPQKIPDKGFLVFHRYEPEISIKKKPFVFKLENEKPEISYFNILVSTQRALIGCITANVRYVRIEYGHDFIFLYFYYDQDPSEIELHLADNVAAEVARDFPGAKHFNVNKTHFPFSQRITEEGDWVFHRYEPVEYKYEAGRSIFEHYDAQELLDKFAGKGRPPPGLDIGPGYKEVVDFKEHIGYFINETKTKIPTTKGTILYSKKGAHIVPTHPESLTHN